MSLARGAVLRLRLATLLLPLLCLSTTGFAALAPSQTGIAFNAPLFSSVIGTALNFLGPRSLEAESPRQFTLWGLGGITALDPSLTVDVRKGLLRLVAPQDILSAAASPAPGDLVGWTQAAVALAGVAYRRSALLREAGQQALLQSFFDELFNHLDPYSRYIAPGPADADRDQREGYQAGPGITVRISRRGAVVSTVNANGPAWAAGVSGGRRLLAVDGHSTRGQNLDALDAWLHGPPGSVVALTFSGSGHAPGETLNLTRARVPPETVFAFSSGDLVVLRVTGFSADTAEEISEFLDQVMRPDGTPTPVHGLIFDLRGNRGGLLQQAVTAVALVLDRGVAVITHGRDPRSNHIWSVRGGDLTRGMPIVVLVDGRPASAAEIMAAALADHRRAVVVGSATLGKGLVQTIAQLPDGGELFVTWSRVIAPLGWPLQGLGVMPEVCTSLGQAALRRALADLARGVVDNAQAVRLSRAARAPLPMARILEIRGACPAAIGGDADLETARVLLDHPARYAAALVPAGAGLNEGAE